jgi:FKBP-type peptidyl-prolyl cis-trans isomerase 2
MKKLITLLILVLLISGCGTMAIKKGDRVGVLYTGTLADGTVFDKNDEAKPLMFNVGAGQVIKGFDDAVIGMKIGESKKFTIPAKDAYGPRNDDLKAIIDRSQLPKEINNNITVGQQLVVQTEQGPVPVNVLELNAENVTIDMNHPMAGKDLTFEIRILKIN